MIMKDVFVFVKGIVFGLDVVVIIVVLVVVVGIKLG